MSAKNLVMMGMTVGSFVGGYVPVIFGVDAFSLWSIFWGAVGGVVGIWAGWKLSNF